MSAIIFATSAALIASSAASGSHGSSMPMTHTGELLAINALVMMVIALCFLFAAMTRSFYSKWESRFAIAAAVFGVIGVASLVLGLIHDVVVAA